MTYGPMTTWIQRVKSGEDALGNDVFTAVETDVQALAFDPGTSSEQVQGQDVVTTQPTVYYPSGVKPVAIDAIRIDNVTYEIDGSPNALQSPFTAWQPGVIVRLRAVTG